jgi:hypothetical protein
VRKKFMIRRRRHRRAHTPTAARLKNKFPLIDTRQCGGFIYSPPTAEICLGDIGVIEFASGAGFTFLSD